GLARRAHALEEPVATDESEPRGEDPRVVLGEALAEPGVVVARAQAAASVPEVDDLVRDEREPAVRLVGVEAAVGEKADALAEDAAVEPAPGAAVAHAQLAARRRAAEERGARLEEPLDAIAQLLAGLAEVRSDGDRHLRVARARRELLVRTGEEERLGQL